jgi:hypothetical protein
MHVNSKKKFKLQPFKERDPLEKDKDHYNGEEGNCESVHVHGYKTDKYAYILYTHMI